MEEINPSLIPQTAPTQTGYQEHKSKKILRSIGKIFWQGKVFPAFWTITSFISITINILLLVIIIIAGRYIFAVKTVLQDHLLAGFYTNFILMDDARIKTSIPIHTEVPAKFDLTLDTDVTVVLTEDTFIPNASVKLATGGLTINAPADIWLPANTALPIHLNLVVPVDQKIPVNLDVKVDIPLNQTDLHEPFLGLQTVLDPYYKLLWQLPGSWQQIFCNKEPSAACRRLFPK